MGVVCRVQGNSYGLRLALSPLALRLALRQSDWAMIQEGRGGGKGVWDSFRVNVCFIQREASHEKLPA